MNKLILASASQGRAEILRKFNIAFSIEPSQYKEIFTDELPEIQVLNLSKNKIKTLLKDKPKLKNSIILGADTCISLDGNIIGKPKSKQNAAEYLQTFSGRTHQVITGLTLYNGLNGLFTQNIEITDVLFAELSKQKIDEYLITGEWKNVAGGYQIQKHGALFICSMDGSWYNIMGLPIRIFYGMLTSQELTLFRT